MMLINRNNAYSLFGNVIDVARKDISEYVSTRGDVVVEQKSDQAKSLVTDFEKQLGPKIYPFFERVGIPVVSEEGSHSREIVKTGDYATIDEIDGSGNFIQHVRQVAMKRGRVSSLRDPHIASFLARDQDYALLLGIVENGRPRFGASFNYVTGETIFLDSEGDEFSYWGKPEINLPPFNKRFRGISFAQYIEMRTQDNINKRVANEDDVVPIMEVQPYGWRALAAQVSGHESACAIHRAQKSGLWDILPAAVASEWPGSRGKIYDDTGKPAVYTEYCEFPGNGITVLYGDKFSWVPEQLKI